MNWYSTIFSQTLPSFVQQLKQQLTTGPENLCLPPANLCPRNKGIERSKMPQFDGVEGQEFVQQLKSQGVSVQVENVPVGSLIASQDDINGFHIRNDLGDLDHPINEPQFQSHPIFISQDNFILDGHHRWAALLVYSYMTQGNDQVNATCVRIGMPFDQLVRVADKSQYSERDDIEGNVLPRQ